MRGGAARAGRGGLTPLRRNARNDSAHVGYTAGALAHALVPIPLVMNPVRRLAAVVVLAASLAACAAEEAGDGFFRGPGLRVASLPTDARVIIYDAAVREAFDVSPDLHLLLDSTFLTRERGLEPGKVVPRDLANALRTRGVVKGACNPLPSATRGAPVCDAPAPGYIVRFSEIFRMPGDTVQVHLAAERYNTPTSAALEVMRFEKAYQVVGKGTTWRVARAGRVVLATSRVVAEASAPR